MGWSNENKPGWERETLERLVQAQVVEQRRARRWGIFFKLLLFIYLFALLVLVRGGDMGLTAWFEDDREPEEHVAVVEIDGLIASSARANAEELNKTLQTGVRGGWHSGRDAAHQQRGRESGAGRRDS